MERRFLLIALVLFVATELFSQHCGTWRWAVKTLTDPQGPQILSSQAKKITITELAAERAPQKLSTSKNFDGRIDGENNKVSIDALIIKCKVEPDKDYHLVLQDPNTSATLVSEIPSPNCDNLAGDPDLQQRYQKLRSWFDSKFNITSEMTEVDPPIPVKVEGVAFWDAPHGVSEASDQGREIHPITDFITNEGSVFAQFAPAEFKPSEVPDKPTSDSSVTTTSTSGPVTARDMLDLILLAAILGMAGQVVRFVAGLRKSTSSDKSLSESLDTKQMLLGFLIALIVGSIAGVLASLNMAGKPIDNSTIIAFLAAGYAGTDLIEGFVIKK